MVRTIRGRIREAGIQSLVTARREKGYDGLIDQGYLEGP
jgi:hypothetical protein